MKFLFLILNLFVLTDFTAQDNFVTFSGKVNDCPEGDIKIMGNNGSSKSIKLDVKGLFHEQFAVEPGIYMAYGPCIYFEIYLMNGLVIEMEADSGNLESLMFKGDAANENNFLAKQTIEWEKHGHELHILEADPEAYSEYIHDIINKNSRIYTNTSFDKTFRVLMYIKTDSENFRLKSKADELLKKQQLNGVKAPGFSYEDKQGKKVKLKDYLGKYVYIDVWATWCAPCRKEMPFIEDLITKYKDKNIEFISITVDKKADYAKWKSMIANSQGIHLFADNSWKSKFISAFGIHSIPRFLLIDPSGIVLDANALKPSDLELQAQLDNLLK